MLPVAVFASRTRCLPCHILVDRCCYRARSTPICKLHFVAVQPSPYTCTPSLAAVCRHGSIREPVVYNPGAVQLDGDVCLCTGMCAAADAQQLCAALVRVCIRQAQYASTCSAINVYHLCEIAVNQCRYLTAVKCEGYHGFANHLPLYTHRNYMESLDKHKLWQLQTFS